MSRKPAKKTSPGRRARAAAMHERAGRAERRRRRLIVLVVGVAVLEVVAVISLAVVRTSDDGTRTTAETGIPGSHEDRVRPYDRAALGCAE
ncbi:MULTISPECIES: hypothetical protein [Streptomyces]|uniref:Uncharacterized protein n=1 Tax=Streptomyces dengpaensis TaxID=2049881 RepID=A0ABN5ICF7_9ACTN|nr:MULTISPECIES: hypothetical protein [Streptomyces]AVH60820.1 hypothetical protein C4B68_39440 [Streptomyces dengpaensis]PIB03957.1 hypothetical protein B1C81_34890 [Streptomyces sp. HG99]